MIKNNSHTLKCGLCTCVCVCVCVFIRPIFGIFIYEILLVAVVLCVAAVVCCWRSVVPVRYYEYIICIQV